MDRNHRRDAVCFLSIGVASDWRISTPAKEGMDAATLAEMDAHARAALPHVRSILIARHDHLVFEKYYTRGSSDELQSIQSMTKSVTSALVGIAIKEGPMKLDQRVLDFFPEIDSPRDPRVRAITVGHLLSMSSGIREGPPQWDKRDSPAESALMELLDVDPGVKFNYSSYASQILATVINRATHKTFRDFADASLFHPLGISNVVWYKDESGIELACGSSLWKATGLLKFGQLYLDNGS